MKLSTNNRFKRATANGVAVRGGFGAEPEKRGKTPTKKVEVFLLKDDNIVSKGKAGDIVRQLVLTSPATCCVFPYFLEHTSHLPLCVALTHICCRNLDTRLRRFS